MVNKSRGNADDVAGSWTDDEVNQEPASCFPAVVLSLFGD